MSHAVTLMCPCSGLYSSVWTKSSVCFTVVLLATSPSYFRGFTLIALKDGRDGTSDDDYIGQFQVSVSRCGERSCTLSALRAFRER